MIGVSNYSKSYDTSLTKARQHADYILHQHNINNDYKHKYDKEVAHEMRKMGFKDNTYDRYDNIPDWMLENKHILVCTDEEEKYQARKQEMQKLLDDIKEERKRLEEKELVIDTKLDLLQKELDRLDERQTEMRHLFEYNNTKMNKDFNISHHTHHTHKHNNNKNNKGNNKFNNKFNNKLLTSI